MARTKVSYIERYLIDKAEPRPLLLIDDNFDDCKLIRDFSVDYNCTWTIASSYDEAVQQLLSNRFALIFLDLNLGTIDDGIRTFSYIKRSNLAPVIVLSSFIDANVVERITSYGVTVFAQKPKCFTREYFDDLFALMGIPPKPEVVVNTLQPSTPQPTND